jgi:hypothetical protein
MTSRLRRVEPGEPITAATFNALVDALNQALRITAAFPVEARRHPGGTHISLAFTEREALVELTSSLSSGGSATARILHFDGDDWIDADSDTIEVHDAIGSLEGNPGDKALVRFHRQSGRWLVWQLQC